MIEILKKGTKKVMTCKKCGCEFSYEDEDIMEQENILPMYSVIRSRKEYIKCPQCNNEITLSSIR